MNFPVYSYRDKLNGFGAPVVKSNELTAIREFGFDMNNNLAMNFSPSDFDLYKIADFDPDTGILTPLRVPVMVTTGFSVIGENDA